MITDVCEGMYEIAEMFAGFVFIAVVIATVVFWLPALALVVIIREVRNAVA